jgi:hypothetical protein
VWSLLLGTAFALALPSSLAMAAEPPAAPRAPAPADSPPARREPTAGDLATARAALREGLTLREKGETNQALARLASAYDLVPTPVTGFELGKTQMMLGRILQAHELFKKVVRMPPSMEESARSQTARDEAARLAKELEPRIPSLRLKVQLPAGASAVVRVDDDVVATTGPETTRAVDPGPHDVFAKAGDGPEEKVHVEVAESETKEVVLAPQWVPPKKPPPGKTEQVIYLRTTNPLAFVGFGIAAAAVVVAGISLFVYQDARSEAAALCGQSYCPPATSRGDLRTVPSRVIDASFDELNTKTIASGATAIASGITAAVFLGVGIVGVTRPIKERVVTGVAGAPTAPLRLSPQVGLGGAGIRGTF